MIETRMFEAGTVDYQQRGLRMAAPAPRAQEPLDKTAGLFPPNHGRPVTNLEVLL